MPIRYPDDYTIKVKTYSHCTFEEVVGDGAMNADPRAWVIPNDKKFDRISIKKAFNNTHFYKLESKTQLPDSLKKSQYSSAQKAVDIVNNWLAVEAASNAKKFD